MQHIALTIFLIWSAITVAIFVFVARSGGSPGELPLKAYKRNRVIFLFGLVTAAVVLLVFTLPLAPYPNEGDVPDRIVYVSGKQFAFKLSDRPISRKDALDDEVFLSIKPIRAGEFVEFRISAADVTHGFCIYDRDGKVLTQTQAMPGYVNRLRHRFVESGVYPVLCFEFCGIGHHTMKAQLEVVDNPAAENAVASSVTALAHE
jgi:cytochrome c oxidase subunit II